MHWTAAGLDKSKMADEGVEEFETERKMRILTLNCWYFAYLFKNLLGVEFLDFICIEYSYFERHFVAPICLFFDSSHVTETNEVIHVCQIV